MKHRHQYVLPLLGAVMLLASGGLWACGPSATRSGAQRASGASGSAHGGANYLGGSIDFSTTPNPRFALSVDVRRSDGCSQTFVSTRARGRVTVVVSRHGVSRLTVELNVRERTGPTRRPPSGVSRVSRRRWKRVYQWQGNAGFMGPAAQLHLKPVGKGCAHTAVSGILGTGCRATVPPLLVECNPARLTDAPRNIVRRKRRLPKTAVTPTAVTPTRGRPHVTCQIEVVGRPDRVKLPHDLRFLHNRRLLLTRKGQPEVVLDLFYDGLGIEGELRRPRAP